MNKTERKGEGGQNLDVVHQQVTTTKTERSFTFPPLSFVEQRLCNRGEIEPNRTYPNLIGPKFFILPGRECASISRRAGQQQLTTDEPLSNQIKVPMGRRRPLPQGKSNQIKPPQTKSRINYFQGPSVWHPCSSVYAWLASENSQKPGVASVA